MMSPLSMHSVSALMTALAEAAARSIVLGGIVGAATAVFGGKNVRMKLFAWKCLLLAALAMPALVLVTPAIRVAVPVPNFGDHSAAASTALSTEPDLDSTTPVVRILPDESAAISKEPLGSRSAEPSLVMPRVIEQATPAQAAARREIPWLLIAFSVYAVVGLALMARILVGIAFGNRLVRTATPVDEPRALEHLSAAARAVGLRSLPRLAESEILSVPIMIGVRKPTILLPADGRVWEQEELAAVLLHEVSHVARRDALSQRLALIHRAIFWFSPLAWWLERHLADLSEQASDEAALAGGVDRTRYAEALLGFFADLEVAPARVWWQGVSMAQAGQAEKRVDRILAWKDTAASHVPSRGKKLLVVAFAVVAVPVIALTAAVRLDAYDIQAPPAPAAPVAPVAAPIPSADPGPQAQASPAAPAVPAVPPPGADAGDADVHVMPLPPLSLVRVDVPDVDVDVPQLLVNLPRVKVDVPPVHVDIPPVHVAVPQFHIETHMLSSQDGTPGDVIVSSDGDWNFGPVWRGAYYLGRYDDEGSRFAIVTKDSDALTMSGDREDAQHARSLKKKYSGDFIWFQHEEKSYVIDDAATVARAKQLWQPQVDLERQQKDLAKQQEDLAKQEEEAANKIEDMKIKLPDLSAEMQKLQEAMKKLSENGGTMYELRDLQGEIGELQSQIGEAESGAGREQGAFGRVQGEWGRKMGELGRQQGELGRRQAQLSREASRQMRQLLDDAVAKGLAKPE
jgi:bla regulator protein blaR1